MARRITLSDADTALLADILDDEIETRASITDALSALPYHEERMRHAVQLWERVTGKRHPILEIERLTALLG